VPPQEVWFLAVLVWKLVWILIILVWNSGKGYGFCRPGLKMGIVKLHTLVWNSIRAWSTGWQTPTKSPRSTCPPFQGSVPIWRISSTIPWKLDIPLTPFWRAGREKPSKMAHSIFTNWPVWPAKSDKWQAPVVLTKTAKTKTKEVGHTCQVVTSHPAYYVLLVKNQSGFKLCSWPVTNKLFSMWIVWTVYKGMEPYHPLKFISKTCGISSKR